MKEHFISLDDTIEPPKTIHHILTVEVEEDEHEIQVDETIFDIRNSDFKFADIEAADFVSEEIGYETLDDFMNACIDVIYKNGE